MLKWPVYWNIKLSDIYTGLYRDLIYHFYYKPCNMLFVDPFRSKFRKNKASETMFYTSPGQHANDDINELLPFRFTYCGTIYRYGLYAKNFCFCVPTPLTVCKDLVVR